MNLIVIVLNGPELNATLAGIEFDHWGQRTNQPTIVCDNWAQGFGIAKSKNYSHALFVRSGTLFTDWNAWISMLTNYPCQGLIGHLIWHPGKDLYLDDQCWFIDLKLFTVDNLTTTQIHSVVPLRSTQNIHDDYTPLWVYPGGESYLAEVTHFGQGLIAQQLNNNKSVVNWSNRARELKTFCYPGINVEQEIQNKFKDYLELAETQLWVFNNEKMIFKNQQRVVTPGSGLYWMFSLCQPITTEVAIVDISKIQIKFCNELWAHWNGNNYGEFVWNFIKQNQLTHYEVDQANLDKLQRLMLKKPSYFINYVNEKFNQLANQYNIANFATLWTNAKATKNLSTQLNNLVDWVLQYPNEKSNLWASNILEYKWTKLNTKSADFEKFKALV